jgi:D-serine deaminase-like pyridoxal phosphate-dependent protein
MNSFCQEKQLDFRPHFKTHQSAEIGEWFKARGIEKCTVSSIAMAQYFANAGWKDICVAIPFNINEIEEAEKLASSVKLSLCVDHIDALKVLGKAKTNLHLFIEIDSGYGRSGVFFAHESKIDALIEEIRKYSHLSFAGFLSHTGNSYQSLNAEEGQKIFEVARHQLVRLKHNYQRLYPHIILSLGDTPSSAFAGNFDGVDEWRPGNFIFYDFMQYALGTCTEDEIAVSLYCPVIGIYPERCELVIYGGGVHLSKEAIQYQGQQIYGYVRLRGHSLKNGFPVVSLSQEHGIIKAHSHFIEQTKIGDFLEIIPVHSCMTADLNASYFTSNHRQILKYRSF